MSGEYWTEAEQAENFVAGVQVGAQTWADICAHDAGAYGQAEGFVYFIAIGDPYITHVKVGFTRKNPAGRLLDLQTGCPFKMRLLGFVVGNLAMEAELHDVFADHRCEGEWFEYAFMVENNINHWLSREAM